MVLLMIKDRIERFLEMFPNMTKEEADFIEEVLHWDQETKLAFLQAKRLFEER